VLVSVSTISNLSLAVVVIAGAPVLLIVAIALLLLRRVAPLPLILALRRILPASVVLVVLTPVALLGGLWRRVLGGRGTHDRGLGWVLPGWPICVGAAGVLLWGPSVCSGRPCAALLIPTLVGSTCAGLLARAAVRLPTLVL